MFHTLTFCPIFIVFTFHMPDQFTTETNNCVFSLKHLAPFILYDMIIENKIKIDADIKQCNGKQLNRATYSW